MAEQNQSVVNKIKVNKGQENEKILEQGVSMFGSLNGGNGTLIDFKGPFTNDDKTTVESIFSLDKTDDGLSVTFKNCDIFKDADGNALSEELKTLKVEKAGEHGQPAISLITQGEELIVNIISTDKQKYTITASATKISLTYGDKSYEYNTNNEHALDMEMSSDTVENILNDKGDGEYFQTPDTLNLKTGSKDKVSMPPYLIGLYVNSHLEPNKPTKIGKFEFFKIEVPGNEPFVMATQPNSKGKDEMYLFESGTFRKSTSFCLQFEQPKKDPRLVITTTNNHNFALKLNAENNKLSQESISALKYFQDAQNEGYIAYNGSHDNKNDKIDENFLDLEGLEGDEPFRFYVHDKLKYDTFKYKLKANTYEVEDEKEGGDITPPPGQTINITNAFIINKYLEDYITKIINEKNITEINQTSIDQINDFMKSNAKIILTEIAKLDSSLAKLLDGDHLKNLNELLININNSTTKNVNIHSDNDLDKNLKEYIKNQLEKDKDKTNEDENADVNPSPDDGKEASQETEKEEAEEEETTKKKDIDLKKPVEVVSNAVMNIGVGVMLASMIPGVGLIAAIIGVVLTAVGGLGVTFADKFVWSPYERANKILDNIDDYETEEDDFLANEAELDNLHELTQEKVAVIEHMLENDLENGGNAVAQQFAKLYNENGVGFAELTGDQVSEKFKNLMSLDGYPLRKDMTESLREIYLADGESKTKLIDSFAKQNFVDLSPEAQEQFKQMFSNSNQYEMQDFLEAMTNVNDAQEKERILYRTQKMKISDSENENAEYDSLYRIIGNDKLTKEGRMKLFERYGTTILKSFTIQDSISAEKINMLMSKVPEAERNDLLKIINQQSAQMQSKLDSISTVAETSYNKTETLDNALAYAEQLTNINQEPSAFDYVSEGLIKEQLGDYLTKMSFASYNMDAYELEVGDASKVRRGATNEELNKAITQIISSCQDPKAKEIKGITDSYKKLFDAANAYDVQGKLAEMLTAGVDITSILPTADNLGKDANFDELARKMAKADIESFEREYTIEKVEGNQVVRNRETNTTLSVAESKKLIDNYTKAGNVVSAFKDVVKSQQGLNQQHLNILEEGLKNSVKDGYVPTRGTNEYTAELANVRTGKYAGLADKDGPLYHQLTRIKLYQLHEAERLKELLNKAKESANKQLDQDIIRLEKNKSDLERKKENIEEDRAKKLEKATTEEEKAKINKTFDDKISKVDEQIATRNSDIAEHKKRVEDYITTRESEIESFKEIDDFVDDILIEKTFRQRAVITGYNEAVKGVITEVPTQKDLASLNATLHQSVQDHITHEENIKKVIAEFSSQDQDKIMEFLKKEDYTNKPESHKLLIEAIVQVVGAEKYEEHQDSITELYKAHIVKGKNGKETFSHDEFIADIGERKGIVEAQAKKALLTNNEMFSRTKSVYGPDFISQEYNSQVKRLKERNAVVENYNSPIELLTRHYNVPLNEVLNVLSTRKENESYDQAIEKLLKRKTGIDLAEYRQDLKRLNLESKLGQLETMGLSTKDQEVLEEKEEMFKLVHSRQDYAIFKEKAETFTALWDQAKTGTDLNKLSDFCQNNIEFLKENHLDSKTLVSLIRQASKLANQKDKIKLFEDFEKHSELEVKIDAGVRRYEAKVEDLTDLAAAVSKEERELVKKEQEAKNIEKKYKEFNAKVEAILNLEEKGYKKEVVYQALTDFANGNVEALNKFNIQLGEYYFSEADAELMKALSINPSKDLIANLNSSKLDMDGKQKALIKNLTNISKKVSKQISTINKAKDKLELTVKSSNAEQRDGLNNDTLKDRFSLVSGLFERRQRKEEKKERDRQAALEKELEATPVVEAAAESEEQKDQDAEQE